MDFSTAQQRAWANKAAHGFNMHNVPLEFMFTVRELAEAFTAWREDLPDLGEELADAAIFLLSVAEMTGCDLGAAVEAKLAVNEARVYKKLPSGVQVKE
jgi:NTP pyrophosphatase (non-canonical NTP hydrolase)